MVNTVKAHEKIVSSIVSIKYDGKIIFASGSGYGEVKIKGLNEQKYIKTCNANHKYVFAQEIIESNGKRFW